MLRYCAWGYSLTSVAAQNMTSIACEFPDRDRGVVSTAVTFTSMSVALVFVTMRMIAFTFIGVWNWDDVLTGMATVSLPGYFSNKRGY